MGSWIITLFGKVNTEDSVSLLLAKFGDGWTNTFEDPIPDFKNQQNLLYCWKDLWFVHTGHGCPYLNIIIVRRQALGPRRSNVNIRSNQWTKIAFQLFLDPPEFILKRRAGKKEAKSACKGKCPFPPSPVIHHAYPTFQMGCTDDLHEKKSNNKQCIIP